MRFKVKRSDDWKANRDLSAGQAPCKKRDSKHSLVKSIVVFLIGLLFTWQIWSLIVNRRLPTLQEIVEESADSLSARMNNFLEERVSHLQVLAQILGYRPPLSQQEFDLAAGDLTTGFPEWRWIQYMLADLPGGQSRPFSVKEFSKHQDIDALTQRIEAERPYNELTERNVFAYPVGEKSEGLYALRIVIRRGDIPGGVLWAVLDLREVLSVFFKREKQQTYHYIITGQNNSTLVTDLGYHEDIDKERPYQVTRNLIWLGYLLRIDIWPQPYYMYARALDINVDLAGVVILIMGILFSSASAFLTWNVSARTRLLQVEVDRRTTELSKKNDQLRTKNEEIENFIYTISHDLKSPIVSIQGFTSILKEEFGKNLGETGSQYVERVLQNTRKMHHLIQDLLELSRIGQVEEKQDLVDTGKVISEIIGEHRNEIDKKHIQISIQPKMPVVNFPRIRMQQVFDNLITNAIKYSDDNRTPQIAIEFNGTESGSSFHHFIVRDNGIGIEKEYQEKIFQIFQRVHVDRNIEGTGIGLSIVKKIVEKYGGLIWVTSQPGEGSKFEFTIPKEKAA